MVHSIPETYRLPLFEFERPLRRAFVVSGAAGVLVLLVVLVAPRRDAPITEVEQVPERFARLILSDPQPEVTRTAPAPAMQASEPAPVQATPPPAPRTRRQPTPAPLPVDAGKVGREKAQKEVSASLEGATQAAQSAIQNLTTSLGKDEAASRSRPRTRRGSVRGGRSGGEIARVDHNQTGSGMTADLGGSGLTGTSLQIEPITTVSGGDGSGDAAGGQGSASSPYRSNASLLAVVKRYAPGIQFCYDNELKRSPGIRGKIVTALTVSASGKVIDVTVVTDTVGSAALRNCALSQIREWKFPAVPEGTVVFRTPFVFTPPQE